MDSGLVAEFASAGDLIAAVGRLRAAGYERIETYTPFQITEIEEQLGIRRSRIPQWVLAGGIIGGSLAFLLEWWTSAIDYPLIIGGRPLNSAPAFIPITFEATILAAGTTVLVSLLAYCRLPRPAHPVFSVEGFESATIDKFWVAVDHRDPQFNESAAREHLLALKPLRLASFGVAQ
jgi:Protein of unknown function (DUF3341)